MTNDDVIADILVACDELEARGDLRHKMIRHVARHSRPARDPWEFGPHRGVIYVGLNDARMASNLKDFEPAAKEGDWDRIATIIEEFRPELAGVLVGEVDFDFMRNVWFVYIHHPSLPEVDVYTAPQPMNISPYLERNRTRRSHEQPPNLHRMR